MPSWLWPTTLDEAVAERQRLGDAAMVVGGGVWATLLVNQGLVQPDAFLALGRVAGLDAVAEEADGTVKLGAMARLTDVARSPVVRGQLPFLADTYARVANERVRNQGTVGGNLGEADYASDPATTLVALGATVRLVGPGGTRELPVADLLLGHYETAIRDDELLVDVRIRPTRTPSPSPSPRGRGDPIQARASDCHPEHSEGSRHSPDVLRGHYLKFVSRSSEDRPCAGVAVVVDADRLTVAIGAVEATPRAFALPADVDPRAAAEECAGSVEPLSDLRGSADYRRRLVRALVPRAIDAARGRPLPGPLPQGEGTML